MTYAFFILFEPFKWLLSYKNHKNRIHLEILEEISTYLRKIHVFNSKRKEQN